MADDYFTQLVQQTGLAHYPKQGPFGHKEGAVIGAREGYLLAIGPETTGNQHKISFLLRFKPVAGSQTVKAAFEQHPAVQAAKKGAKSADAGTDFVRWNWPYSFGKPKADQLAALATALVEAAKPAAQPFDGRCEVCQKVSAPEIVLKDGVPGYFCSGCQQQMQQQLDAEAVNYENLPTDFAKGLAYGLGAMVAGALAWGLVAYWLKRIFLWGAILIGYLIAKGVQVGMGKIERSGQVLVAVLTVASVLLGDALFFTLIAADQMQTSVSLDLLAAVLANFWELETQSQGGVTSIIFALVGAGYALYSMKKPGFKVKFEQLGAPAS